mmetsp:Transcript_16522/g.50113  ORF Transcript_16522/g.50113 Transcript_16522/m.50113 type:complete len:102 (+) Transcript_16522:291-596(+)
MLPEGVSVGDACLAETVQAGERKRLKGVLLSARKTSPHLLVKFVGTERGEPFTSLSAPGLKSSYLTRREVAAWVAPPEGRGGAAAGPRAANSDEYKLRERR